jgi:phosphohistidine phosphatase SixA
MQAIESMTTTGQTINRGVRKSWRSMLVLACLFCAAALPAGAVRAASHWAALQPGTVVLFRHALAPGTGDPARFKLGDCSSQRNLNDAGRAQAVRIGAQLREHRIVVGKVLSSQWCRALDTARLAFPGFNDDDATFDSFFNDAERSDAQTAAALQLINAWRGPGVLVVISHQVNITALTGIFPGSGEGVIIKPAPSSASLDIVGRVQP